ncbi:MAG: gfo/Idh/MocA family oxidoreductase, partial [Planctomycetota bacterium]
LQPLGESEREVAYERADRNFAGDCCYWAQRHFVDRMIDGAPFETSGDDYLRTLAVQEAVYQSADTRSPVEVKCP